MNFKELFVESKSVYELAIKLGYKNPKKLSAGCYKAIKVRCERNGLDYLKLTRRKRVDEYDESIKRMAPESRSIRDLIIKVGLNPDSGSVNSKIRNRISFLGIDISHFTGSGWSKGKNRFTNNLVNSQAESIETSWQEAFKRGGNLKNESLMKRLILAGKITYQCCICGISRWNGKSLRLRLDHIDGDNTNNLEENLRIICPNCDSQTDTFSRGQRPKSKDKKWWEMISDMAT